MKHFFGYLRFRLFLLIINILFTITNPMNAQWTSLSTAGGDKGNVCVHGNKLFMGGVSGTIWQSTDEGTTWQSASGSLSPISATYNIVSDGTNIYASRGEERLIKSTDDGTTWNQINNGIPASSQYPALFATGGKVYAGGTNGIYVSTDEGSLWMESNNGLNNQQISVVGGRGDTILAGTNNGKVFRSINAGQLWTDITPSFSLPDTYLYFISVIDNSIFIGGTAFGTMGIVRTDDWGLNWVQDNEGIVSPYDLQAGGIVKIDTFLFAGMYSGGIYKRSVNNLKWSIVSGPQMMVQAPPVFTDTAYGAILSVAVHGTNLFAQVATSGLFRSTDMGLSWEQVTNSAGDGGDRRALSVNNEKLYLGGDGGVLISTDYGKFWKTYITNVNVAARISSYAFIDSFIFAGQMNLNYGMLRSTDGGKFWIRINEGLPSAATNINKLAVIGSTLFAGTASGIYMSSDYGDTWNVTPYPNEYVSELYAHGNTLFAFSQYILNRSTDMGQTWAPVTNGISQWDWVDVTSKENRLFLAGGGIFTSTDDGVNWTDITGNLSPVQYYSVSTAGDTLYAASAYICYYTTDLGQTWTPIPNDGFPLIPSFRHSIVHGGYIFAGMGESGNLGGAWKIPVPGTTSVEQISSAIPSEFELMQNYPNPFNPSTTIEFRIPASGTVDLRIYDILGREVSTLVNGYLNPGSYKVSWDAFGMSTGVYFSRLVIEDVAIVKQMLLIK